MPSDTPPSPPLTSGGAARALGTPESSPLAGVTPPGPPVGRPLRERFASALEPRRVRLALAVLAWVAIVMMLRSAVEPFLHDFGRWGHHDWDSSTATRLLTVLSLERYHQFPFWNPYACGGYSSWGYVEGGTNVVSPWLPFYLSLPIPIALRVEVIGTALLAAIGTWLLAGRFTRSVAARTLVVAVFAFNGRWALQAAAGHLWHCYYAWMPWALYFFDRAHGAGAASDRSDRAARMRSAVLAGAFLALMVYTGAIYPLPHTIFIIAVYGVALAVVYRTLRPIVAGAVAAASFLGLSAPKLLPTLDTFAQSPRLVDSHETLDLDGLVALLTSRDQDFGSRPVPVSQWGWHEWGMYVGWVPFAFLALGALYAGRGRKRELALKGVGLLVLALGFGAIGRYAPWTLLHQLPIFSSQHVPSRWLYPAVLLLGLVSAAGLGRRIERSRRWAPWLDAVLLAGVVYVGFDIASIASLPLRRVFWMQMPPTPAAAQFHQESKVPPTLQYVVRDWVVPSVPAMLSNTGVLECYGVAGLSIYSRRPDGTIPGQGAKGVGDPAYHGEAYTVSGAGQASIVDWTPNRVTVHVAGAHAGDTLVLNENFDPSWRANGAPATAWHDAVATTLSTGDATVTFQYRPRRLAIGIAVFMATIAAIVAAWSWERRRRHLAPIAVQEA